MRKSIILFSAFMILAMGFLAGCGSGNKNKVIGLWKVTDVQTQFDESKVNPSTLQQVAELEKQTMLNFSSDSTLTIMMGEKNFAAFYTFDPTTGKIEYSFDGVGINMNELGVFADEAIVSASETPVGTIKVTYTKSK
jgi:hypothetical protein